jgi:hypothetical protein
MANSKERDPEMEYQAGAALVDDGITFKIPFLFGLKLRLKVRPIRGGTLIRMSMQVAKMKPVNESEQMIPEMFRAAGNLKYIYRIIALGCTNRWWSVKLLSGILAKIVEWNVRDLNELFAYLSIVYRQTSPQHFFFIMALTKGMNYLEKKPTSQEKTGEA